MGVRILSDSRGYSNQAALYCSTAGWAFGPVFTDDEDHDAVERAEAFCRWLQRDPRGLTDAELQTAYGRWRAQEAAQWIAEAEAEQAQYAD